MIIPCIDLQGGKAVQLVRGRKRALSVDDVLGLLERFRDYPILHVIDLDAAVGTGSNGRWIKLLSHRAKMKIRVGGGIRSVARKNVILALDTERGQIVVRGWRQRLKLRPADVIPHLEPYCSGFLCTFVDNEGTMKGTDLAWFRKLRRVTKKPITAAGGIRSLREVRALEKIGMHAAVGMALYLGKFSGS